MGLDILRVVEESRRKSTVPKRLNATFLALIPKSDKPEDFSKYRPISLGNTLYKLVAKVIGKCIKPFLAKFISLEQFGFLFNRQILDAVGIAQEGMYSIKVKKLSAFILKLDLVKASDRLDWTYIRLLLTQIGIPLNTV